MAIIVYNKIVAVPSSGNMNPAAPKAADKLNLSLAESSIQIGAGGFFKVLDSESNSLVHAANDTFTVAQAATFSDTLDAGASTLASAVVSGTLSAGASTLDSATVTNALSAGASTLASAVVSGTLDAGASTLASAVVSGTLSAGASTLDSATVTNNLTVTGNLTVNGTTTSLQTTNTQIKDNILVLNDGEVGEGVSLGTSGISIERGGLADATILWVEATDKFNLKVGENFADLVINDLSAVGATLTGNLAAVDATLSGDLAAVDGTFSGNIAAVDATLSGDLAAVDGTFSGNIAAVDATLSGDLAAVDATLSGNIAAVDATLSGDLAAVDATLSGNLAAVDGTFSGDLAAVDATLSGNIAAVDGTFSGNIAAVDATLSGDLAAVDGTFSGNLAAVDATLSGNIAAVDATLSGNIAAVDATLSGDLAAVDGTFSGNIAAVDATLSGDIAAVDATLSGAFAVAAPAAASIAIDNVAGDAISFSTATDGHIHLDAAKILKLSAAQGIATNHTAVGGAVVSPGLALSVNDQGKFVAISAVAKNALVLGVSLATIESDESSKGKVAEFGKVEIQCETGASFGIGEMLYLSSIEAGKVTNVVPTTEDSTAYMMGVALTPPAMGKVFMALHRQFLYNN